MSKEVEKEKKKEALQQALNDLKALGVTKVVGDYNGSGDSGSMGIEGLP